MKINWLFAKHYSPEGGEGGGNAGEAALIEKIKTEVNTAIATAVKSKGDEVAALKTQLDEFKAKLEKAEPADYATLKEEHVGLMAEIKALKENGGRHQSREEQLNKFLNDNFDKIKAIKAAGSGFVEFEFKAPATITTGSVANPDGIPTMAGVNMAPPSNVNYRNAIVSSLVSTINTDSSVYAYTESIPKDGDFAFVAEGATKPQIDLKVETRYAEPVKIAAWEKLTEEAVRDIPSMQSIATDFLRKRHDLRKQKGILFGDGISPNPKGVTVYAKPFTAGSLANSVVNPNFMDVINAAITKIYTTHNYQDEMPYMASIVMVNPIDFYVELVSAKDGYGRPLYPDASLFNRVNIGGVTIIPEEDVPSGKILVADLSRYNITNWVPYTVKIGWVNDDFIKNQFVILGESRFHAFVKKLDENAFIYDDIATIKSAITKV